tara:strand:+ start:18640 stop:19158 length:519 start_codon:yes stop_codon:yes gene_type:complete
MNIPQKQKSHNFQIQTSSNNLGFKTDKSLSSCLDQIKIQWKKNNEFALISQNWHKLVGEKLATNSTPINLKGGVLIIGASHPQWRQALFYTRTQIIESLRSSGHQIKALKVQQYHSKSIKKIESENKIWAQHPSRIDIHGLKNCTICHTPSPSGEIDRWRKCSFCRRKELSK